MYVITFKFIKQFITTKLCKNRCTGSRSSCNLNTQNVMLAYVITYKYITEVLTCDHIPNSADYLLLCICLILNNLIIRIIFVFNFAKYVIPSNLLK